MSRKASTWFGIGLSKRQATNVFILSLAGIILLSMIFMPFIFSFISSLISAVNYGEIQWWIQYALFYFVPFLTILSVILIIAIYSLLRCRKIAVFYSDVIDTSKSEVRVISFCPNCGNKRTGEEKFCRICGEDFK